MNSIKNKKRIPWNKGKSKETDARIKRASLRLTTSLIKKYQEDKEYRYRTTAKMHTPDAIAKMKKTKVGMSSHRKGLSMTQEYGEDRAKEIKQKTSKNRRGKAIGKNSSNWRGGISLIKYRKNHKDSEINDWRKAVFERDNFTCQNQKCKKRGVRLEAHHIKPVALFPELELNISNGLTLCYECHKETKRTRIHRILSIPNKEMVDKKHKYLQEYSLCLSN